MPRNSESCQNLCNLLLLVALLNQLRPGLRLVEPESLIRLVGLPRKRPPNRSDALPALALLDESLAAIPKKDRPKTEFNLFLDALEELNQMTLASEDFPVHHLALAVPSPGEPIDSPIRSVVAFPQPGVRLPGLVAVPTPGGFFPGSGPGGDNPTPTPVIRPSFTRTQRPFVCRLVGRTLLPTATSGASTPLILSAAITAALGCGVGISRGT